MSQSTTPTFVDPFAPELERDPRASFPATVQPVADGVNVSSSPQRFHLISYLIGLLTALLLVGGMDLLLHRSEPPAIVLQPPPTLAPTATPQPTATTAPIVIFVSGAVQQPGMYALGSDSRVGDALAAAGGLTLQANVSLVNQAERLWDGAQVHVPFATVAADGLAQVAQAPDAQPQQSTQQVLAAPVAGLSGLASAPSGQNGLAQAGGGLISINRASPTELETLPGIGPSKAAAIVANRPYSTIEDLERVPGIGTKTVEQLRPLVTVD